MAKGSISREVMAARMLRAEELFVESPSISACVAQIGKEFGITERASWRYVARVRARWDEEREEGSDIKERESRRRSLRRTLDHVKARGFESKDYRSVLGATKQLRNLDGLDEPKEMRLSGAVGLVDVTNTFAGRSTSDLISFLRSGRLPSEPEVAKEET